MRIVIDLQGAQTNSRFRGIGRYSLALAIAMIKNRKDHEIIIALNGMFDETIEPLREAFYGMLPKDNIRVWNGCEPVYYAYSKNAWRRKASEFAREAFIASLNPDIVYLSSVIEGYDDNAVHSISNLYKIPVALTFYDVIPLIENEKYLAKGSLFEEFYYHQISLIQKADLLFGISQSSCNEAINYLNISSNNVYNIGAATEDFFMQVDVSPEVTNNLKNKFNIQKEFIMYSGASDERKNHLRLFKAFSILSQELRDQYQLVIVGGMPGDHKAAFLKYLREIGLHNGEVILTGRVTDDELVTFYNLCSLFVFPSWHEGFGIPALEAMSCGAAVIGSNTTSVPEVIGREDALFDPFDENDIAKKITEVLVDKNFQKELSAHGLIQAKKFSWDRSAKIVIEEIERWSDLHKVESVPEYIKNQPQDYLNDVMNHISKIGRPKPRDRDLVQIAQSLAINHSLLEKKQLFVDISELIQRDAKSGIQRVVRSILKQLLHNPPTGFSVEPVYATVSSPYKYARRYAREFMSSPSDDSIDMPIDYQHGDVFLGLDLSYVVNYHEETFSKLRQNGVNVYFVLYDMVPLIFPEYVPENIPALYKKWVEVVLQNNGVMCISKSVAIEFERWIGSTDAKRLKSFSIDWFHLGADVEESIPTKGVPETSSEMFSLLALRVTFLMVGTIEPRKGYREVLKAFEELWSQGYDINLVVVGKEGWNMKDVINDFSNHSELGKRFFWLNGISDEYLEKVYESSTCLIAASVEEGFGLPLIEAAQYKMPIIARDIPVFKEVAGDHAYYFKNHNLIAAIKDWLQLYYKNKHTKSDGMPWLYWKQSVSQLMINLINSKL